MNTQFSCRLKALSFVMLSFVMFFSTLMIFPSSCMSYGHDNDENEWLEKIDEDSKDFTEKYVALCEGRAQYFMRSIRCYSEAHDYWDKILNVNYKIAMKMCGFEKNPQQCRTDLRNAQREWIKYRDREANASGESFKGGTFERIAYPATLYELTRKRAEELERRILNR